MTCIDNEYTSTVYPKHDNEDLPAWWKHFEGREMPEIIIEERSIHSFLDNTAEKFGKNIAIKFQNYKLNYAQLKNKAEILAYSLQQLGIKHGDRVAVMLPNIPQTMIAVWGIFKAGAVVVMINPLYKEQEIAHYANDSQSTIMITLDLLWSKIDPIKNTLPFKNYIITKISDGLAFPLNVLQTWQAKRAKTYINIQYDNTNCIPWKEMFKHKNSYNAVIADPAKELALLQYTGGTTGIAKGAMLSHKNLSAQLQILNYIIGGNASNKKYIFLSIMPFFHIFGLMGNIVLPCLYAAPSIPIPRFTPGDLLRTIVKHKTNVFVGAPSIYMSLMQQKDIANYNLSCIELCISGASPFPVDALEKFQALTMANITEGFGLTEASPCVLANPIYGEQKAGSVGVPLPATAARIVDAETGLIDLGDNEFGEIIIKGPQIMQGYWNNPAETAMTIRNEWLFTGDIAYRDSGGFYFLVDRKKDLAIVGGYNVYPREIDEVLYQHPNVLDAVAVGIPHKTRGEIIKAYVVPKANTTLTISELTVFCRAKLANYKVPKLFELRDELPKSAMGKILKRKLIDEELQRIKDASIQYSK